MSIKRFLLLALCGLAFQFTGCTSGDGKSDVDAAEDVDAVAEGDEMGDELGEEDSLASDTLPEESLGTDALAETGDATGETAPEIAEGSIEGTPETPTADAASFDAPPAETEPTMIAESAPPTPEAAPPDALVTPPEETKPEPAPTMAAAEEPEPEMEKPKPAMVPLRKVAEKPWKVGKNVFNTVYFAKPGDTLDSISQMIYGADKTKVLKSGNPSYASRDPKPGDKVYYPSPNRPDDMERMLTSYEDTGIPPQIYVAKQGDNIRAVSKNLFGYDGAWKEVWSSNPVESKGELEEGTELRYWASALPAAPSAAATTADASSTGTGGFEVPAPPPMPEMAPPEASMAMNDMPPPPPMPESVPPPPPPMPEMAQNDIPPPPPMEQMAPPPPPPPKMKKTPAAEAEMTGMDEDQMMALGVVAVAAAGIAALLVVRKRRKQKELEQQIGDSTHVG